jgi:hypothetical protein
MPEPAQSSASAEPSPPKPLDTPTSAPPVNPGSDHTLAELEESVKSSHLNDAGDAGLDAARDEVNRALSGAAGTTPQPPIEALNAQPLADNLNAPQGQPAAGSAPSLTDQIPGLNPVLGQPEAPKNDTSEPPKPGAPPPVPPPFWQPNDKK